MTFEARHQVLITLRAILAAILRGQEQFELSKTMQVQLLHDLRQDFGPEHEDTWACIDGLAQVLTEQGNYDEAEQLHREILDIRSRAAGLSDPTALTAAFHVTLVNHM